jgi:hypothetical protein
MVFNATFNNISVILWWPVLLVEETGEPGENHRPMTIVLNHCHDGPARMMEILHLWLLY